MAPRFARTGEPPVPTFKARLHAHGLLKSIGDLDGRIIRDLPRRLVCGLIRVYQLTLGPALPAIAGPGCGCRFTPTCSHYALEAVRTHGALGGGWLAVRRLARCTPLCRGGFDPVPVGPDARAGRPYLQPTA